MGTTQAAMIQPSVKPMVAFSQPISCDEPLEIDCCWKAHARVHLWVWWLTAPQDWPKQSRLYYRLFSWILRTCADPRFPCLYHRQLQTKYLHDHWCFRSLDYSVAISMPHVDVLYDEISALSTGWYWLFFFRWKLRVGIYVNEFRSLTGSLSWWFIPFPEPLYRLQIWEGDLFHRLRFGFRKQIFKAFLGYFRFCDSWGW